MAALASTAVAVVIGLLLPYTPLAPLLGMTPPTPGFFVFLALAVPSYLVTVELVKARLIRGIVKTER